MNIIFIIIMNNIKKILDNIKYVLGNRELYITYNNNIFLKENYIFLVKRLQDHKHMVATISSN